MYLSSGESLVMRAEETCCFSPLESREVHERRGAVISRLTMQHQTTVETPPHSSRLTLRERLVVPHILNCFASNLAWFFAVRLDFPFAALNDSSLDLVSIWTLHAFTEGVLMSGFSLCDELASCDFGDKRLSERLKLLVRAFENNPQRSIPSIFKTRAEWWLVIDSSIMTQSRRRTF